MSDIASLLQERLGEAADQTPTETMADALFREVAANTEMAALVPDLGRRILFSSAKATRELGWHPRPARDAVVATARSLLDAS